MARHHQRSTLLVAVVATLAACGSARVPNAAAATPPVGLRGDVTVFAAASLAKAFGAAQTKLEATFPGIHLTFSFAGSQQLAQNLIDGAPADVVATADTPTMQRLVHAGLVDSPRIFARNALEIAVAPGNPKHIRILRDLARADVTVVLADPSVPAGKYADEILAHAGVAVTPKSLELNVETALERVESGDADAAIVYRTDVIAAAGRVAGVAIPTTDNVVATYPIAITKATRNATAAHAFVAEVLAGIVRSELLREGFVAP